jgi:hypothetical protein
VVIKAIYFCFLTFPSNFAKVGDRLVLLAGSVGPYNKASKRADRKDSDINTQITTSSTRILQFSPKHPSRNRKLKAGNYTYHLKKEICSRGKDSSIGSGK